MQNKIEKLRKVFEMDEKTVISRFGFAFYDYYKKLFESDKNYFSCFINRGNHILELIGRDKSKVLDFGCGCGLWSILIGTMGNVDNVYGIDTSLEKITGFQKLLNYLELDKTITASVSDGHNLDFEDGFFDVVVANDVLSHMRDLDLALSEISRTLKKGGVFFMYDGNNSIDIIGERHRKKLLEQCENGPIEPEITGISNTYLNMRKEIIKSQFKNLDEDTIEILAKKTKGMYGDQIKRACGEYLETGGIIEKADYPYRNPRNGEKAEAPFNPFHLKTLLRDNYGIDCRVLPPFTSTPIKWKHLAGEIIKWTHPISLIIAPGFELIGIKS